MTNTQDGNSEARIEVCPERRKQFKHTNDVGTKVRVFLVVLMCFYFILISPPGAKTLSKCQQKIALYEPGTGVYGYRSTLTFHQKCAFFR